MQEDILKDYKNEESILNIKGIIGYIKYYVRKASKPEDIDYDDILKVKYVNMLNTSLNVSINKLKHVFTSKYDIIAIKEALEI